MADDNDQSNGSSTIRVPIGPVQPPSEESVRLYREYQAREKHGTDTVTITVGTTPGGNTDINYTDNHGNRLNSESNNGVFDFCVSGKQLSEAQIKQAISDVRSQGDRADYRFLTAMGVTNESYEFRGPNPIEKACAVPSGKKGSER